MDRKAKEARARKTAAPFPVRFGMGEHGLAYCLIRNQEIKTPWRGGDENYCKMRWETVDAIIDCRAHGMRESEVIVKVRRFVRDWFESGVSPKLIGNPAVRVLAHLRDSYPLNGTGRFVNILIGRGFHKRVAAGFIADAVRNGHVQTRRGRFGVSYWLTCEPKTRAVRELADRVAAMMAKYPGGVPFRMLRDVACRIAGGGIERGAALIERAVNAGVLRSEMHGAVREHNRVLFPNFKTKGV